jgi:outer membrane biosynthesis protein TonB
LRQEAARLAVLQQELARQAAARQELERVEAARLDAERQAAAQLEAARLLKADQEEKRLAVRRAMGRQLDEEAARRDAAALAARQPSSLLPLSSSARRGRLFGRTDANAELLLYAEAWSRKIQLNMTFDMVREAAKQRHSPPLVTVALRSDGSVESVTFVLSSGVPAIDDAIRRIVQSQAPYPAFSQGLAREFDVIEIRRTWNFDTAIRLY